MKMSFICIIIENHFHINGFALSLVLKVRFFGTRKWPIIFCKTFNDIASVMSYLLMNLRQNAFVERECERLPLLGVYHAKTWDTHKKKEQRKTSRKVVCKELSWQHVLWEWV